MKYIIVLVFLLGGCTQNQVKTHIGTGAGAVSGFTTCRALLNSGYELTAACTLVGAWLGDDDEINKREIAGLIKLAKEGYVDIAAVGNEVMYRGDLTEDELLDFMQTP